MAYFRCILLPRALTLAAENATIETNHRGGSSMNIGILGAGNIAGSMARTICGMAAQGRPVTLCAVASRSQEKADAFAKAYGIPRAYGSYAAMLNDPLVELVYISPRHTVITRSRFASALRRESRCCAKNRLRQTRSRRKTFCGKRKRRGCTSQKPSGRAICPHGG